MHESKGPINFIMDDSVPKFMLGLYLTKNIPNTIMNAGFQRAIKHVSKREEHWFHQISHLLLD